MTGARLMNISPVHPGRGKPSVIQVAILLDRKGEPIVTHELALDDALRLLESLALAIRVTARPKS